MVLGLWLSAAALPDRAEAVFAGVPDVGGRYEMLCRGAGSANIPCPQSLLDLHTLDGLATLELRTVSFTPAMDGQRPRSVVVGEIDMPARGFWSGPYDSVQEKCLNLEPHHQPFRAKYEVGAELVWTITTNDVLHDQLGVTATLLDGPREWPVVSELTHAMRVFPKNGSAFFDMLTAGATIPGSTYEQCATSATIVQILDPRFWVRLGGPAPLDSLRGFLVGRAVSSEVTATDVPFAVHRAKVTVLRQTTRAPGRSPGQTDSEYLEQIEAIAAEQGWSIMKEVPVGPNLDDSFGEKGPGYFKVEDLPLFVRDDGSGSWVGAIYAVKIEDAETEEFALDDMSNPIPGQFETLHFRSGVLTNLTLFPRGEEEPEEEEEIALTPIGSLGAKRNLIAGLSEICEANYALIEGLVANYLDDIENEEVEFTEAREEGLRRGIWAERAVLAGTQMADEEIEVMLTALGRILGDLYSDLVVRTQASLSETSKKVKRFEQLGGIAKPGPNLDLGFTDATVLGALAQAERERFVNGQILEVIRDLIKTMKPKLEAALVEAGMEPGPARLAAALLVSTFEGLANTVAKGTKTAASVGFAKTAIQEAISASQFLLLDLAPPSAAFCSLVRGDLQKSANHTQQWNKANYDDYRVDRDLVVGEISFMIREASLSLANARYNLEIAAGLSNAQDFLSAIEKGARIATAMKQLTKVLKYAYNAFGFVDPFVTTWWDIPTSIERAEGFAFPSEGLPMSASLGGAGMLRAGQARSRNVAAAAVTVSAPDSSPLDAVLDGIAVALETNQIGDAMEASVGVGDPNLFEALDAWRRGVRRVVAQASAVDPSVVNDSFVPALKRLQLGRAEEGAAVADVWSFLGDIYLGVVTGDYDSAADPDYIGDRARALTAIGSARVRLAETQAAASAIAALANNKEASAALMIDTAWVVSTTTGLDEITTSPETFELTVHVANVSGEAVSNVGASLAVTSTLGSLSVVGDAEVTVGSGSLAMDDGDDGAGPDEAEVTWTLAYDGDLDWETAVLEVQLLEDGGVPTSFVGDQHMELLRVASAASDADSDGLPDSFEEAYGLDLEADDSLEDEDGDDSPNIEEWWLGTRPDLFDSDDDGLGDGEEVRPGVDGFVTDPLEPDSDGDGTDDGSDGQPLDPSTTEATTAPEEPVVALSRHLVLLTEDRRVDAVEVTNAGDGPLVWRAEANDPSLVVAVPQDDDVGSGERPLFVSVPEGFDFDAIDFLTTTVAVMDIAGAEKDRQEILVVLGGDIAGIVCGHGSERSIGGPPTASDALIALTAAVGAASCEACRCDVNDSGGLSASDAQAILRRAVGQDVELSCPAC